MVAHRSQLENNTAQQGTNVGRQIVVSVERLDDLSGFGHRSGTWAARGCDVGALAESDVLVGDLAIVGRLSQ